MEQTTKRSSFSGKLGFVLAAAGSAVGLGNIWRFPYLAAKYGGGIFLLCYLILAVTFGFALMVAEIAIGRKTRQSAIHAYGVLDKRFRFLGPLASLVPIIITPYYCVIGGWVIKYLFVYATGNGAVLTDSNYFGSFISSVSPIVWFIIFVLITAIIVMTGVEKGIEKVSKFMMPLLVILSIGIAVYCLTLPGAIDGVIYYLKPDFSKFSMTTVLAAMGQLFYSMSLAMGIMITYGSYMKKDSHLTASVHQIEIFDTGIAFLAGLMIIPAVFSFTGGADINAGPGLMFITLPKVFGSIAITNIIGVLFFVLVIFAALTSAISLMETVVSIICDKTGMKRLASCIVTTIGIIALGSLSALGYGVLAQVQIIGMAFLDFFDFISNSVLMPVVALLTCILVGYVIKPAALIEEAEAEGASFKGKKLFVVVIKYIAPVCIIAILITSVLSAFGFISI
ncbi:sodium-dependent transporter [Fusibacillus kribbianus]|uniref:Transporter n=1 Tax=Fusibacillus kribbianus TaxID=3044208 RepID=A0AAP4B9L1_9FIRM|nr:sodium-dependent transporter [Ruminococcus sp. YH-rum2234]MDI9241402.1 sodium-dependent transporter [Ruminococcus sp. YH-rum2234]